MRVQNKQNNNNPQLSQWWEKEEEETQRLTKNRRFRADPVDVDDTVVLLQFFGDRKGNEFHRVGLLRLPYPNTFREEGYKMLRRCLCVVELDLLHLAIVRDHGPGFLRSKVIKMEPTPAVSCQQEVFLLFPVIKGEEGLCLFSATKTFYKKRECLTMPRQ